MTALQVLGWAADAAGLTSAIVTFISSRLPSKSTAGSKVRLQVGVYPDHGGDVPKIRTFRYDGLEIERYDYCDRAHTPSGYHWCHIKDRLTLRPGDSDDWLDITTVPRKGVATGWQPLYMHLEMLEFTNRPWTELTGSPGTNGAPPALRDPGDHVCLATITTTWHSGDQYAWLGDFARYCNRPWYPSEIFVGDHPTYCGWLGNSDHERQSRHDPGGVKIHMPSFLSTQLKHKHNWYCDRRRLQFTITGDRLYYLPLSKPPPPQSGLLKLRDGNATMTNNGSIVEDAPGPDDGLDEDAPPPTGTAPVRRPWMERQLVVSNLTQHNAAEVCESATSYGPDFVSLAASNFCDMGSKALWPLCNETCTSGCFDHAATTLRSDDGSKVKRDTPYNDVRLWNGRT